MARYINYGITPNNKLASAISPPPQPVANSNITAGATIPVVAQVKDSHGNAIGGDSVTLAIANNAGGAALSVTTNPVSTDSSGKATFAGVYWTRSARVIR